MTRAQLVVVGLAWCVVRTLMGVIVGPITGAVDAWDDIRREWHGL